jgi:hypothetical protein
MENKSKSYVLDYQVKNNPNYNYKEEFDTVKLAMERAMFVQNMFNVDGVVTVLDDDGDIVVEVE